MSLSDFNITLLKKLKTDEVFDEYAGENFQEKCPLKLGAEFISKNMEIPEGFYSFGWIYVYMDVAPLSMVGDFHWIKEKGKMISLHIRPSTRNLQNGESTTIRCDTRGYLHHFLPDGIDRFAPSADTSHIVQ